MEDIGHGSFRAIYGRQMNIITAISRKEVYTSIGISIGTYIHGIGKYRYRQFWCLYFAYTDCGDYAGKLKLK